MTLRQRLAEVIGAGPFVLGVDFDGTISELVDSPDEAVPVAGATESLSAIAASTKGVVAVLSGRARGDLLSLVGDVPHVTVIGEHGNDWGDAEPMPDLEDAKGFLDSLDDEFGSSFRETKNTSVTLHTRGLSAQAKAEIARHLEDWVASRPQFKLMGGKEVWEVSVASKTKADAIESLRRPGDIVIYIGDDVTDESVFRRLGKEDVGIKVGAGLTEASYRLAGPTEVVELLKWMTEAQWFGPSGESTCSGS